MASGNHRNRSHLAPALPVSGRGFALGTAALAALLAWAYWPVIAGLARRWSIDAQYSHGYLVPVFAAVLVWLRRKELARLTPGFHAWGLPFLVIGGALLVLGGRVYFSWFEEISILPTLAGVCLLLGGWKALGLLWPAVGFLVFMVPLPFRLEKALAEPLQSIATAASTYTLQTLGLPALREGNVIVLDDVRIGVVEACSGLSMLVVFVALSVAIVILVKRPILDKVLIVASAIPIAIIANVVRIVVTGFLHQMVSSEAANAFFHYFAGLLMMPLALVLMWLELKLLSWLLVEVKPVRPLSVDLRESAAPRGEKVLQPRG